MPNRDGDLEVLRVLAASGSNLNKPAHIIHYLYFPLKKSARSAAAELVDMGYEVFRVHRSPTESMWQRLFGPRQYSCIVESHYVPSEDRVFAASDCMTAMAARFGGEYDGWEASVEP